tara:strand:- start:3210 stop:4457 length:1248 start_codon:yes stop_codon:yes gene_type:complete
MFQVGRHAVQQRKRLDSDNHIETWSLPSLLGGMSTDYFASDFLDKNYLCVKGGLGREQADALFSLEKLDRIITSSGVNNPQVEVIKNGTVERSPSLRTARGFLNVPYVLSLVNEGCSIRIRSVDDIDPEVADLCRDLSKELNANIAANLYFTPYKQPGFNPHFDDHDVLIVQTAGKKKWKIYSDYEGATALPPRGQVFEKEVNAPGHVLDEFVLSVGDVLYIPRGMMHAASAEDDGSIHLTLSLNWTTWAEFLFELVATEVMNNDCYRKTITDVHFRIGDISGDTLSEAQKLIQNLSQEEYIRNCAADIRHSYIQKVKAPTIRSLTSLTQRAWSMPNSRIRLRNNALYEVTKNNDDVPEIIVHGENVALGPTGKQLIEELIGGAELSVGAIIQQHGEESQSLVDSLLAAGLVEIC